MRLTRPLVRLLCHDRVALVLAVLWIPALWAAGMVVAFHPSLGPVPVNCVAAVLLPVTFPLGYLAALARHLCDAGAQTLRPDAQAQVLGPLLAVAALLVLPALLMLPLLGSSPWAAGLVVTGAGGLAWWLGWSFLLSVEPTRLRPHAMAAVLAIAALILCTPDERLRALLDHPRPVDGALLTLLVTAILGAAGATMHRDGRRPEGHRPRRAASPPQVAMRVATVTPLPPLRLAPRPILAWARHLAHAQVPITASASGAVALAALVAIGAPLAARAGITDVQSSWFVAVACAYLMLLTTVEARTLRTHVPLEAVRPVSRLAFAWLVPACCAIALVEVLGCILSAIALVLAAEGRWGLLHQLVPQLLLLGCMLPGWSAVMAGIGSVRDPRLGVILLFVGVFLAATLALGGIAAHAAGPLPHLRPPVLDAVVLGVGGAAWPVVVRRWRHVDLG